MTNYKYCKLMSKEERQELLNLLNKRILSSIEKEKTLLEKMKEKELNKNNIEVPNTAPIN